MNERLGESWRRFKNSKPGNRFQNRYRRRQQQTRSRFNIRKMLYIIGGVVVAIGSLALAPLPGPGWGTFFVGLGMIAGESLYVAKLLDNTELEARELAVLAREIWTNSSITAQLVILLVALVCVAALVYAAYYLLFGG